MTINVVDMGKRLGGIGKFAMERQNLKALLQAKDEQIAALRAQMRAQAIEHAMQVKSLKDKLRKQT